MSSSGSPTTKRAALAQLRSTSNKLENMIDTAKCAGWAQREGASMLFLPECFGFMGENAEQTLQNAEPPVVVGNDDGGSTNGAAVDDLLVETISSSSKGEDLTPIQEKLNNNFKSNGANINILGALRTIAKETNLWISAGGMHVSGAPPVEGSDRQRVYNTHIIIDDRGNVQCLYRKIHLFDVSIPGKVILKESNTTAPGTDLVTCDSPIGKLGVTTCYDVRFPEMYIRLVQEGAQIMLVPSAFTVPTGKAHWHTLLRARAIESQCYVLAAAQYGRHNEKRESYGKIKLKF